VLMSAQGGEGEESVEGILLARKGVTLMFGRFERNRMGLSIVGVKVPLGRRL
jgi:hypothetical protein